MSRRKGGKRRQQPAQRRGSVFLRLDGGAADGMRLKVPGFTAAQYRHVQQLVNTGALQDPLIGQFVRAFASAIGHDVDAQPEPWTDSDTLAFLCWLGMLPEDRWTVLDDMEFAQAVGGAA